MKRKIVIIILLIVLFALGVVTYFFIDSIKEDQAITKEKAAEIIKSYEKFNSSIQAFAALREEYYNKRQKTYLEEFSKEYKDWDDFISKYEKSIQDVEDNTKVLKTSCTVKFADPNVSSKCDIFKANYEAAMNYYIADIKGYNKTVKQYNKWAEENKKGGRLKEGKLVVYKKYIDFDKDGEYFGKGDKTNE